MDKAAEITGFGYWGAWQEVLVIIPPCYRAQLDSLE